MNPFLPFANRWAPVDDALTQGQFDPWGANGMSPGPQLPPEITQGASRPTSDDFVNRRLLGFDGQPPLPRSRPSDAPDDVQTPPPSAAAPAMAPPPPAMGGYLPPSVPDDQNGGINALGNSLTGAGASLMSIYNPRGGAVLADLQGNQLKEKLAQNGRFVQHFDPKSGKAMILDARTGRFSTIQAAPPEDVYGEAYKKANADEWVKRNASIMKEAGDASSMQNDAAQLKDLLANPNVYQGVGGEHMTKLKQFGNAIFGAGTFEGVPDAQLAQAIANKMALGLRNPSLGGGMPGALSDSDRNYLASMPPNLSNDREGNQKIADYWMRLAKRSQDIEAMRQEYVSKYGRLDDGFAKQVTDYANKNKLFKDESWGAKGGGGSTLPDGVTSIRVKPTQ